jgi:hypothetical protein
LEALSLNPSTAKKKKKKEEWLKWFSSVVEQLSNVADTLGVISSPPNKQAQHGSEPL